MKKNIKTFSVMFFLQMLNYFLITLGYIAIARENYFWTAISDFLIASFTFFVIKKIANSTETKVQWLGFALGGVVGSLFGIYVAQLLQSINIL